MTTCFDGGWAGRETNTLALADRPGSTAGWVCFLASNGRPILPLLSLARAVAASCSLSVFRRFGGRGD